MLNTLAINTVIEIITYTDSNMSAYPIHSETLNNSIIAYAF